MTFIITAKGYRGRRRVQKAYTGETMREAIDQFRKEFPRDKYEIETCQQSTLRNY